MTSKQILYNLLAHWVDLFDLFTSAKLVSVMDLVFTQPHSTHYEALQWPQDVFENDIRTGRVLTFSAFAGILPCEVDTDWYSPLRCSFTILSSLSFHSLWGTLWLLNLDYIRDSSILRIKYRFNIFSSLNLIVKVAALGHFAIRSRWKIIKKFFTLQILIYFLISLEGWILSHISNQPLVHQISQVCYFLLSTIEFTLPINTSSLNVK